MANSWQEKVEALNKRNPILHIYRFDEIQRAAAIQMMHYGSKVMLVNGLNYVLPMEEGKERALFAVSAEELTSGMMSGTFSRGTYAPDALKPGSLFCINTKEDVQKTDATEYFKIHSTKTIPLADLELIKSVYASTMADWKKKSAESVAATEGQIRQLETQFKQLETQIFALKRKREGLVEANEERRPKIEDILGQMY